MMHDWLCSILPHETGHACMLPSSNIPDRALKHYVRRPRISAPRRLKWYELGRMISLLSSFGQVKVALEECTTIDEVLKSVKVIAFSRH